MRDFNKSGGFGRSSDGPKKRSFRSEGRSFERRERPEGRSFDRPRYDRGDSDRGRGALELHKAVCADCGETCEVPFKPRGNKPVYCRECFKKNDMGEVRSENRARSEPKPERSNKELEQINEKLDKIMKSLNIE